MANEEFLQFIWKHGFFLRKRMRTVCGRSLEILKPGEHNFHAGPDFFNASIRMGQLIWAGNVEIHLQASHWIKHGHHLDPAYDNVILHVVKEFDGDIWNSRGRRIHTLVIDFPTHFTTQYETLWSDKSWLPCYMYIGSVPSVQLQQWLRLLQAERLQQKTGRISSILKQRGMDWDETFYRVLASGYGLPINSLPFEMVSSRIPLQLLMEIRDSIPELEALLFGQSGFLHPGLVQGPYATKLMELYSQMAASLPGKSIPRHLWKFLRLRPSSFPTLRLSQFASLIQLHFPITNHLLEATSLVEIEQILRVSASKYWETHYVFGKCSPPLVKYMGHQSILTLIINVIVPFLQTMGKTGHSTNAIQRAHDILSELEAESNHIIKKWAKFGIKPRDALESQALIQLHNDYCKQKRCFDCQIGASLIKSAIHEK